MKFPYSFYFLIFYILGIIFAKINLSFFYFFLFLLLLVFVINRKSKIYFYITLIFLFLLGFYLYRISFPQFEVYSNAKLKSLTGIVEDSFEGKDFNSYVIKMEGFKEKGKLNIKNRKFEIGDKILLEGVGLYPLNQGNLYSLWDEDILYLIKAEKIYLIKRGYKNSLERIRNNLRNRISNVYSVFEDYKEQFLLAIVMGERRGLSEDVKNLFVNTGTSHLLAISGLHLSFLINIFSALIPLRRILVRIVILPLLVFYGWIIGDNPPVWRVIGQYVFILLAFLLRREEDNLNAIFWVAFVNLVISPLKLFNVSFQLSYLAMLGLLYKPNFSKFLPAYLQEIWESSFWLMIFLAPLNIYYFGSLKPISIIANFFAIPIFSLVLFFSFLYLIGFSLPMGFIFEKILSKLIDILFESLQLIGEHYKISLLISVSLILLPVILRKREENELLGV